MKNLIILALFIIMFVSCEDNLNINPQGSLTEGVIDINETWVDQQLISAYAMLDGNPGYYRAPASNWTLGDVASDDFHKGTSISDQPELNDVERYAVNTTNRYITSKWQAIYEGIHRCNQTINSVTLALENGIGQEKVAVFEAEARFLRAFYHMEAKKIWDNIPYIDETVEEAVPNDIDIWPEIETDLLSAIDNLPGSQDDAGRATAWVAKCYLAKAHMFQKDFNAAGSVLDDIINNGPYSLVAKFHDNFDAETEINSEAVFAVQNSVNDGGSGYMNGNRGNRLNHPYAADAPGGGCCGFFQPSQNLVNAFKTDENGLPYLDTFNDEDLTNDEGITSDELFFPYEGNVDPRLDWTVGRRGIEFLGWGDMPGMRWVRDQANGGPYVSKKHEIWKYQEGTMSSAVYHQYNAINTPLIRYSDVLLWRAEVYAENNELDGAKDMVNIVRRRAANPDGFVKSANGTDAANYVIGEYPAFPDKEYAIKAVRFERRLELASEGHRFFDLVRWGIAEEVLDRYIESESVNRVYLKGANFIQGTNEYYPIPLEAINTSKGVLIQNNGY